MRPKRSLLLDTHTLVWVVSGARQVSARLQRLLAEPEPIFYSPLSLSELALKARLGKFEGLHAVREAVNHLHALPFDTASADALQTAGQWAHKDPFDLMLLAQAIAHNCWLETADNALLALEGAPCRDPRI